MKSSRRAWLIFAGCCMIGLIYTGLVCNTAGLYFNDMAADLAIPMAKVALTMSFLNGGGLLGMAFAGKQLVNGNVRVILTGCAAATGGSLLLGSVGQSAWIFYLMWGVIGFCAPALMSVGVPTLLGNWFERKQGTVLGIVYALSGIGGAVFNALMGQVISRFGWRAAYGMEGVITLAALLPFTLFVFRLKPGEGECPYGMEKADVSKTERKMSLDMGTGLTAGEARATAAFYLMIFANLALTVVSSLLQQISPHVSTLGYDITVSSLVMSAVMAGCAIGNLLLGQLLDRFPTMAILGIYVAFGITGWLGMALTEEKVLLFASGILLGMAQAVFQVGIPYCVRKIFGGREYSGIYASIAFPASAAAIGTASLGGVIFDMAGSYRPVMFLLFLMYVCAGPCIWGALRKEERKDRTYEALRN